MFSAYKKGWQAIVQPPRYKYPEYNLGPKNLFLLPEENDSGYNSKGLNPGGDTVFGKVGKQTSQGGNPLSFNMNNLSLKQKPVVNTPALPQQVKDSKEFQASRLDFEIPVKHNIYSVNSKKKNNMGKLSSMDSLKCSIFQPSKRHLGERPCLIYGHSHSGNKLEGLFLRKYAILKDFDLCLFDFSGCGNSSGDFVSLGLKESDELIIVMTHLKSKFKYKHFLGWGRSMGAVSWILALDKMNKQGQGSWVNSVVLDSPFTKARTMVKLFVYQLLILLRQQI